MKFCWPVLLLNSVPTSVLEVPGELKNTNFLEDIGTWIVGLNTLFLWYKIPGQNIQDMSYNGTHYLQNLWHSNISITIKYLLLCLQISLKRVLFKFYHLYLNLDPNSVGVTDKTESRCTQPYKILGETGNINEELSKRLKDRGIEVRIRKNTYS